MSINVIWLTMSNQMGCIPTNTIKNIKTASTRYRVSIPATYLQKYNINNVFFTLSQNHEIEELKELNPDIAIFTKLSMQHGQELSKLSNLWLDTAEALRMNGKRVIFDLCDNHFFDYRSDFTRKMVDLVDVVTVNTKAMSDIVTKETGKIPLIIPDPVDFEIHKPKFLSNGFLSKPKKLKLLWYGHESNINSIKTMFPHMHNFGMHNRCQLEIITSPLLGAEAICDEINRQGIPLTAKFTPWSKEAVIEGLNNCDIVVIPNVVNQRTVTKSNNRLTDALWSGRFVVANKIPSYCEFSEFAWIGKFLTEGLHWAMNNPNQVIERIKAGQDYIKLNYSPEIIAARWRQAILYTKYQ